MAVVGGPTVGPIVGGAICMSDLGWRWTQYITGIFVMVMVALDVVILDESMWGALLITKALHQVDPRPSNNFIKTPAGNTFG